MNYKNVVIFIVLLVICKVIVAAEETAVGLGQGYDLSLNMDVHAGKHQKYNCERAGCSASFRVPSALKIHERSHAGEKPFRCPYDCGRVFSQLSNCRTHQQKCGDILKKKRRRDFCKVCDCCSKTFKSPESFLSHRKKHDGVKGSFVCQYPPCEKTFFNRHTLGVHERAHTGEKPFKCIYCSKGHSQTGNLNVHLKKCAKRPRITELPLLPFSLGLLPSLLTLNEQVAQEEVLVPAVVFVPGQD